MNLRIYFFDDSNYIYSYSLILNYIYEMKHVFVLTLILISITSCNLNHDYSGIWESRGDDFENTLILKKIKGNKYSFSFDGWRKSYDHFARDTMKFIGQMNDKEFTIEIKDNYAEYTDSKEKTIDGSSLYHEGEDPCKIFFKFNNNIIEIKTENCHLIYGGYEVLFDGKYFN